MNNRSLTERLWDSSLTELSKEETSTEHSNGAETESAAWTFIEQLIKDNEDLKTELTQAEDENSTVEKECSQLKQILHLRNQLDEEEDEEDEEKEESRKVTPTLNKESVLAMKLEHVTAENRELEEKLTRVEEERDSLEDRLKCFIRQTNELTQRLRESEALMDRLSEETEEITRLKKENSNQREKITRLESHRRKCLVENQELLFELERRKEEIAELKGQLHEMEHWYEEYRVLLEEQRSTNASLRHDQRPRILRFISTPESPYISQQSMSSEIEGAIRLKRRQRHCSESEFESCIRLRNMISLVQLTNGGGGGGGAAAAAATYVRQLRRRVQSESSPPSSAAEDDCCCCCCDVSQEELWLGSGSGSIVEADPEESGRQGHDDDVSRLESMATNRPVLPIGCPGRPGSMDLEFALGPQPRLHHLSPLQTGQLAELWNDEDDDDDDDDDDDCETRIDDEEAYYTGCETPRSNASGYSVISHRTEKLQLVKPLEGSSTLLRWHRLALPGIESFLGSHDGVHIKGSADQVISRFEQEPHSISDCEEDDDDVDDQASEAQGPQGPPVPPPPGRRPWDRRGTPAAAAAATGPAGSTGAAGRSPPPLDAADRPSQPQRRGKSDGKWEKWKEEDETEMFVLLNAVSSPVRFLFEVDDSNSSSFSRSNNSRTRCVVS